MRLLITILFSGCFLLFGQHISGVEKETIENQEAINHYLETSTDPLFISLGSFCGPASSIRSAGQRKAAFPVDWMLSVDGEKIIEMLDTDFVHFTNPRYLSPFVNGVLLNRHYHIEYSHEGVWTKENFFQNLSPFQEKYQRRIERFKKLRQYQGGVYFIRSAWALSTHPNYAFSSPANLEISEEYAERLYAALQRYFPQVDVYLIIKNTPQKDIPNPPKLLRKILFLNDKEYDFAYIVRTFAQESLQPT
jgi:tellurite resistance-related uncharacterized protein